jgi:Fur family ferric uptake transcriptional regulator
MKHEVASFKKFLKENRLKCTPERETILATVFAIHGHFDADELVDILKRERKRISRATVYRTLDLMVKAGLVQGMELGESRKMYEHTLGHKHHDHLICEECGRTIEFDDGVIELLQQKVCEQLNFQARGHSLRIFGCCDRCQ